MSFDTYDRCPACGRYELIIARVDAITWLLTCKSCGESWSLRVDRRGI